jgi:hypothetical protein
MTLNDPTGKPYSPGIQAFVEATTLGENDQRRAHLADALEEFRACVIYDHAGEAIEMATSAAEHKPRPDVFLGHAGTSAALAGTVRIDSAHPETARQAVLLMVAQASQQRRLVATEWAHTVGRLEDLRLQYAAATMRRDNGVTAIRTDTVE